MKYNGGPAFPIPGPMGVYSPSGMSMRDYFAAAALQGIRDLPPNDDTYKAAAKVSYAMADAMLVERERDAQD